MGQDSPPKLSQPLWYLPVGVPIQRIHVPTEAQVETYAAASILHLAKNISIPARQNFSVKINFFPFGPRVSKQFIKCCKTWAPCSVCGEDTRTEVFEPGSSTLIRRHLICHATYKRMIVGRFKNDGTFYPNRHDKRRAWFGDSKGKTSYLPKINPAGGISYHLRVFCGGMGVEYGAHNRNA